MHQSQIYENCSIHWQYIVLLMLKDNLLILSLQIRVVLVGISTVAADLPIPSCQHLHVPHPAHGEGEGLPEVLERRRELLDDVEGVAVEEQLLVDLEHGRLLEHPGVVGAPEAVVVAGVGVEEDHRVVLADPLLRAPALELGEEGGVDVGVGLVGAIEVVETVADRPAMRCAHCMCT